jgi:hypothetical protein
LEPVNKAAARNQSSKAAACWNQSAAHWNQSTKQALVTSSLLGPVNEAAARWDQSAKQPLVGTIQRSSRLLEPTKSTKQPLVGTIQRSSRLLEPFNKAAARWNQSTKQPNPENIPGLSANTTVLKVNRTMIKAHVTSHIVDELETSTTDPDDSDESVFFFTDSDSDSDLPYIEPICQPHTVAWQGFDVLGRP